MIFYNEINLYKMTDKQRLELIHYYGEEILKSNSDLYIKKCIEKIKYILEINSNINFIKDFFKNNNN